MPIVQVHLFEGRTVDQKRQCAKETTDVIVRTLGCTAQDVRIIFEDMKKTDYSVGGVLVADTAGGT
jgi:4-oxalocrotonate tautomerase